MFFRGQEMGLTVLFHSKKIFTIFHSSFFRYKNRSLYIQSCIVSSDGTENTVIVGFVFFNCHTKTRSLISFIFHHS